MVTHQSPVTATVTAAAELFLCWRGAAAGRPGPGHICGHNNSCSATPTHRPPRPAPLLEPGHTRGRGPSSGAPLCSAISRDEPSSGELICISCLPGLGRGIFSRHDLPQNSQTSHQVETDDISIDEIIKSHHFTILITDDHFKNLSLCWTFSTGYSLPQPAAGAVSAHIWGTGE